MENEIKVNEYVRIAGGIIARVTNKNKDALLIDRVIRDPMRQDGTIRDWCIFNNEKELIVNHSPNLIDLIQCGDYVNGYKVVETYKDKQLNGWQVGKSKEDETWLGVVVSSKMIKEPLQEYFDNEMIKTIVTKEMMESISYKV